MKQLVEFIKGNEDEYILKFQVFDENIISVIRNELKIHSSKYTYVLYTYIDADSFQGEIVGSYNEVMTSLEILEENGWEW